MVKKQTSKGVGVVLSGGGIRGLAHIGILRELEEANIPIAAISGSSVGALIGAMYAARPDAKALEAFVRKTALHHLFSPSLSTSGALKPDKILRAVKDFVGKSFDFSDLSIPVFVTATDLNSGEKVVFSSNKEGFSLFDALSASCAFPGIFLPLRMHNRVLADGGISDPLPVSAIPFSVPLVISNIAAIEFTSFPKKPSLLAIAKRSVGCMQKQLTLGALTEEKRLFVEIVPDLSKWDYFELKMDYSIIEKGVDAAKKHLPRIKQLL